MQSAEQQGERERMREKLADVAPRSGAASAPDPAQPVGDAAAKGLAANTMLDDVAREDDAHSGLRGELAHDEIFSQVVLELGETADCGQGLFARRDGGADGESHAF